MISVRSVIFLTALQLVVVLPLIANDDKRVLLINSYHPQYTWTAELTKGVQDVLHTIIPAENLHIEYMDERRFMDDKVYHEKLVNLYNYKYSRNKPSIIITSDDPAFSFLVEHGETIFPNTPVIFSGVNIFEPELLKDRPLFTGIVEGESIEKSLELIVAIQPEVKRIIVLGDTTGLGLRLYKKAKMIEESWLKKPQFKHVRLDIRNTFNKVEFAKSSTKFDKQTAILLLAIQNDLSGAYFSYDKDLPILSKNSMAPIYGMWGSLLLDKGILGGMVNNPYLHGQNAARIAVQLIEGESVTKIPIKPSAVYHPSFNFAQLKRFGIEAPSLPNGATIVAKPETFYSKYSTAVNSAIATIVSLIVIISMLITNLIQRRNSQKQLREFNLNLEAMVKQRTSELDERNHALENARVQLETIAFTDTLTALGNRRAANEHLARFIKRIQYDYRPLSIALLDLDFFKKINDTYGHLVGDQVLAEVAKTMSDSIRPSDFAFRWGGEEFLVLLPNTGINAAYNVCKRIKDNISALELNEVGKITVSIGVSVVITDDTCDVALQKVDDALYQAKEAGRNTIVVDNR